MSTLRFSAALVATSLKVSVAHRGAFLMQSAFMLLNNVMFFTTWWILFSRFDDIGGYHMADMLLLFGVSAAGFGLAVVLCGGMLELARAIVEGELDALLAQPKSVLVRAVASRSVASGWGDVVSGLVFVGLSGPSRLPAATLAIVLVAVGFVATACLIHSAAFWLGRVDSLARVWLELVITFSLYPPTLFGGGVKVLLFTLVPAGMVAHLPVEWVRAPSPTTLAIASCTTALYTWLAVRVFEVGRKRYESGNRFGALG